MLKTLKQVRAAFSMLNPDEVRNRAARPVSVGLLATGDAAFDRMEDALGFAPGGRQMVWRAGNPEAPAHVDLVLYDRRVDLPKGAYTLDTQNPAATVEEILRDHEDFALPLARQFPGFRKAVVDRIVTAVARENALFAITTALPDVIPNLMELPWAFGEWASDTAFLTANQIRMAFLISGACGKEVGFAHQKIEIASIAAGAFGWRAIARELAGKIPFGGGLIPKGLIAFAGTYMVGKGLERLHGGHEWTAADREEAYQHGLKKGSHMLSHEPRATSYELGSAS